MSLIRKGFLEELILEVSLKDWIERLIHVTELFWRRQSAFILGLTQWQAEKAMATHSSTLAWKIPWAEEPGRLQSMESLRVGHNWATWLSLFTFMHCRKKWQPTPVFLPGESQGRRSLVSCYGVTQNRTRLKWLSSSSSSRQSFSGSSDME